MGGWFERDLGAGAPHAGAELLSISPCPPREPIKLMVGLKDNGPLVKPASSGGEKDAANGANCPGYIPFPSFGPEPESWEAPPGFMTCRGGMLPKS